LGPLRVAREPGEDQPVRASRIVYTFIALAVLVGLSGCAVTKQIGDSISSLFTEESGPNKVDELVGSVERVYVDTELSKEKTQAAVVSLQTIVASDFKGDALTAYAQLESAIERAEEQAETLESRVDDMQDAAEKVFDRWSSDLKDIGDVKLRQRSRHRLLETRERYDAVVAAVEPTQAEFVAFNRSLRDHALFLGHDLNPNAVSEIQSDVRELTREAARLGEKFDGCLTAARAYVDSAALPRTATQPPEGQQAAVAGEEEEEERVETPRTKIGARSSG
jgi:ElaB/YqjD/DUF883 family membrane-anchored ribosome-binding protein